LTAAWATALPSAAWAATPGVAISAWGGGMSRGFGGSWGGYPWGGYGLA